MLNDTQGMLTAVTQLQQNGKLLRALTMMKHSIGTNINYKITPVV